MKDVKDIGEGLIEIFPKLMEDNNSLIDLNKESSCPLIEQEILLVMSESTWKAFSQLVDSFNLKDKDVVDDPVFEELKARANKIATSYKDYSLPVAIVSHMISSAVVDFAINSVKIQLMTQFTEALKDGNIEQIKLLTEKLTEYAQLAAFPKT